MSVQKNTPNFLKHSGLSFTTIINQTMDRIKDAGALGIYCYLASKPENWQICQAHLCNRFGKGRDYIKSKIKILKEYGLIKIESVRDSSGKIIHWETSLVNFVQDHNTENPYSGKEEAVIQNTGFTTSGETHNLEKPALVIKDKIQIKEKNKNKREPAQKRVLLSAGFKFSKDLMPIFKQTCERCGIGPHELLTKFFNIHKSSGKLSADWNAEFENFLMREKPSSNKRVELASTEPRCNIQEWGPGHPTWDSMNANPSH